MNKKTSQNILPTIRALDIRGGGSGIKWWATPTKDAEEPKNTVVEKVLANIRAINLRIGGLNITTGENVLSATIIRAFDIKRGGLNITAGEDEIWAEHRQFSAMANELSDDKKKKREIQATIVGQLLYALGGALLFYARKTKSDSLGIEKDIALANNRILGEELLSEIWKYVAGAKPYKNNGRSRKRLSFVNKNDLRKLNTRVEEIITYHTRQSWIKRMFQLAWFKNSDSEKFLIKPATEKYIELHKKKFQFPRNHTENNGRKLYWEKRVNETITRRQEQANERENYVKHRSNIMLGLEFGSVFFYLASSPSSVLSVPLLVSLYRSFTRSSTAVSQEESKDLYDVSAKLRMLQRRRSFHHKDPLESTGWNEFVEEFESTILGQTRAWRKLMIEHSKDNSFEEDVDEIFQKSGMNGKFKNKKDWGINRISWFGKCRKFVSMLF